MFANYRYSAILRRVNPSSEANPKNDPVLIGELQGVSGLKPDQVTKGYFGDSSTLRFLQKDSTEANKYTGKKLEFTGDSWSGYGELIPAESLKTYSINAQGTYSDPSSIEGIRESFYVITNVDDEEQSSLTKIYNIHIGNVLGDLEVNRPFTTIDIDGTKLVSGVRATDSFGSLKYINTFDEGVTKVYLGFLSRSSPNATPSVEDTIGVLKTKNVSLSGNTTQELPIYISDKDPAGKQGSIDLSDSRVHNRSLSDYTTMSYEKILQKSTKQISGDFRKFVRDPTKLRDGAGRVIKIVDKPTVEQRAPNSGKDFVNLSIESISMGTTVNFTTFLTSFNDSFSPSWGDIKYVGRQDTLKYFTGVTRTVGLGFKLAAFKKADLGTIYSKLSTLVKGSAIGGVNKGGKIITAPVSKLTFGSWFYGTPCVITSMKFDIQATEYSWDVDNQMPHLVDVSLDFFILGDVTGKALDSKNNDYFRYTIPR